MILRYSEYRLSIVTLVVVAISTTVYLVIGSASLSKNVDKYGYLPTFALGFIANNNAKENISLYSFVIVTLVEGLIFVAVLNWIRLIKREFSMLFELQAFAAIWLFFNDLSLFFVIQGQASSWFITKPIEYQRIVFWLLLLRSLISSVACVGPPLF